jgi:hypothetical protein
MSSTSNFSADLLGGLDTRPSTWGAVDVATWTITYRPPPGSRVRILHVRGDLVAWPKVLPGETPVPEGRYAGVLLGLGRTMGENTAPCDWCEDSAMLYIQAGLDSHPVRAAFNDDVAAGLLAADNKLVVTVAAWLNTTGKPIHVEPTFVVTYRFEPLGSSPGRERQPQRVAR